MTRILHINCACTGSTGKIIGDIADYAANKEFETVLCAPCVPGHNPNIRYIRTSLPYEQGIYRRLNRFYGYQYGFAPLSTGKILRTLKREKPDLVHVHCINGFMVNVYSLLRYLKKHNIPTVITHHAEFLLTGGCALPYGCEKWKTGCGNCPRVADATCGGRRDTTAKAWRKMASSFADMKNTVLVSVSPWLGEQVAQSPFLTHIPQKVVKNGINTDVFAYRDRTSLRQKYGFGQDEKIVFHPTANFSASENDSKGGRYVLELAKTLQEQNVKFVVAGKHAQGLQIPENMTLLGSVADQVCLAEYYALADVTVVAGKRETFNMPVAESLCCGTPVVGFLAGGPESIALDQYSSFCCHGDVAQLRSNLLEMLDREHDRQAIAEQAKTQYAAATMAENYLSIYRDLMKGCE